MLKTVLHLFPSLFAQTKKIEKSTHNYGENVICHGFGNTKSFCSICKKT